MAAPVKDSLWLKIGDPVGFLSDGISRVPDPGSNPLLGKAWLQASAAFGARSIRGMLLRRGAPRAWLNEVEACAREQLEFEGDFPHWCWRAGMVWIPLYFERAGTAAVARLIVGGEVAPFARREVRGALQRALAAVNRLLSGGVKGYEPVPGRDLSVQIDLLTGKEIRGRMLGGDSLALAVAIAVCSWVSKVAIPPNVMITGNIGEDGVPLRVDKIEAKLQAGIRMIPGFRMMVYPKDGAPLEGAGRKAVAVASLRDAIRVVFGRAAAHRVELSLMNIRGAVAALKTEYQRQRYPFVIELAERILPLLKEKARQYPKEHWEAMICLAAAYGHSGETLKADRVFQAARKLGDALFQEGRINAAERAEAGNMEVSPLRDLFRFEEAEKRLKACRMGIPHGSDRGLRGKIDGQIGNLLLDTGRYREAIPFLEESIRNVPQIERARNYCYLGQALTALGEKVAAEKAFRKAERESELEADPAARANSRKYLYVRWAALCIDSGDSRGAGEKLQAGLFSLRSGVERSHPVFSGWPGLLYLLEAYRGGIRIDGKSVGLTRILRAGDGSNSPILRLLSRVACLDDVQRGMAEKDVRGGAREYPALVEEFLSAVKDAPGASRWFRAETRVLARFVRNPGVPRDSVIWACKEVRRRMPNL
jgi:tetratricopeptide (TPR) repeat protein